MNTMKRLITLALLALLPFAVGADFTLREDTASQAVVLGPFVDSTDGNTPETGLTIDAADVRISINGGNIVGKNLGSCTHDELGMYACTFDATDTATVGRMQVVVAEAGALIVYHEFRIVEEAVFDRDYSAAATGIVGTAQTGDSFARLGAPAGASVSVDIAAIEAQTDDIGVAGAGLTAIDLPNQTMDIAGNLSGSVGSVETGGITAASIAADAIGSSELATTAVAEIVDQNWEEAIGDHSATVGSTAEALSAAGGGGATDQELGILRQGTAAAATATTLDMDTGASFADDSVIGMTVIACGSTQGYCQSRGVTDNTLTNDRLTVDTWTVTPSGTITFYLFGTAPSSGSGGLDAAGVRSAVGLASANLDTQLDGIQSDTDNVQTRLPASLVSGRIDASVGAMATNVLTTAAINADAITAAKVAADVGTEIGTATWATTTRVLTAGTNIVLAKGTGITGFNDLSAAQVNAEADTALTDYDPPTRAELTSDINGLLTSQRIIIGTCDSGSTTTCVDNALVNPFASQLEGRLICFDDSWCALITTFTPGTDTVATTKIAPSTRAAAAYTIFPSTLE